jgi:hypothetical protein
MKRIAALAATVTLGMLVVPTAAMASTGHRGPGGWGPGSGTPWHGQYGCPTWHHRKGEHHICGVPPGSPGVPHTGCASGTVTFDMPTWSSVITDDYGPPLHVGEDLGYNGQNYTIASITGSTLTVDDSSGHLFVNGRDAISGGSAFAWCTGD